MKTTNGDSILISSETSSYPFPKSHGTKLLEIAINPKQIGMEMNHTNLKLSYRVEFNFSFSLIA